METRKFIVTISEGEMPVITELVIPQDDDIMEKAMSLGLGTEDKLDAMEAFIECANWFKEIFNLNKKV